jgi:hypothetical protein
MSFPFPKRVLTFTTPSIAGDTPAKRDKVERDLKGILREAVQYLGLERVKELVAEVGKARRGRKPAWALNKLLLAEYVAAGEPEDIRGFSENFYNVNRHNANHWQSGQAVEKRLRRQLKKRDKEQKLRDKEQKLLNPMGRKSLLGTE